MTGLRLCRRRRLRSRRRALFKHSKAKRGKKKSSARFCMLNQHRVCSLFKLQFSPCSVCRARSTLIKYYTSESYLKTNIHTNYQEGNIFLPNSHHHHHRTQTRTFLSVNIYWEQSLLVFICPLYSVPAFNSLQCENHTQLPFASWSNFFILVYLLYTFLGRGYFSNSLFVTSNDQQMPMAAKPFLPTSCNPSFFALVFFLFTFTLAPDIWYKDFDLIGQE